MSETTDKREVRTWRWLIQWPGGPLSDPDGNLIDGSFKRGVYELLDEIEKPEPQQRDRNRIQIALRQFAPGVLDQARRDYLDGRSDLMIGSLGYYDPRFLWISDDMKNALASVLADDGFLLSTLGNGASNSQKRGRKPDHASLEMQGFYQQHESEFNDRMMSGEVGGSVDSHCC